MLYFLIVGIIAGFLGGQIMKGRGFGFVGNLLVGVAGAIIGGWALGALGIYAGSGLVPSIIKATIGSVLFLFIVGLIRKA